MHYAASGQRPRCTDEGIPNLTDAPQRYSIESAAAYDAVPDAPAGSDTKPLTIVIGADTFAPEINGSATFSASLAGGLVRRGHTVHMVAPAAGRHEHGTFQEEHGGEMVTVHRLWSWRYRPHPWLRYRSTSCSGLRGSSR